MRADAQKGDSSNRRESSASYNYMRHVVESRFELDYESMEDKYRDINTYIDEAYLSVGTVSSESKKAEIIAEKKANFNLIACSLIRSGWDYQKEPFECFQLDRFAIGKPVEGRGWIVDKGKGFLGRSYSSLEDAYKSAKTRIMWGSCSQSKRVYSAEALALLSEDPSPEGRAIAAQHGLSIEKFLTDPDPLVRFVAARTGGCLEALATDPSWEIRRAIAEKGVALDVLAEDTSLSVLQSVVKAADEHNRVDVLNTLASHTMWEVRHMVAATGFKPNFFIHDKDERVRETAYRHGGEGVFGIAKNAVAYVGDGSTKIHNDSRSRSL